MQRFAKGRYIARAAETSKDVEAAQNLRHRCFFAGGVRPADGLPLDQDRFDIAFRHILIEDTKTGQLRCCFRVLCLPDGRTLDQSYAAQFYDLSRLSEYSGAMMEVGRFCISSSTTDPDILRIAWAAIVRCVSEENIDLLFGCSSFPGTDPTPYEDTFRYLYAHHLAPPRYRPEIKASEIIDFNLPEPDLTNSLNALKNMPPLLRSYVAMGGWVSDHAVTDHNMGTLHVFTGLDIKSIPATRARLLRRSARRLNTLSD